MAPSSRPRPANETPALSGSASPPNWEVLLEGVRLIALRALGDGAAASDVAQEAVIRAMTALREGGGERIGDLRAYIYGIARHLIADARRAAGRHVPLDAVAEPAEPNLDALEAAVMADERVRLADALASLRPRDQEILRLSFFRGLEDEDIAARLRDNPVNVRKRRSRALARLRRAFLGGKKSHDAG